MKNIVFNRTFDIAGTHKVVVVVETENGVNVFELCGEEGDYMVYCGTETAHVKDHSIEEIIDSYYSQDLYEKYGWWDLT